MRHFQFYTKTAHFSLAKSWQFGASKIGLKLLLGELYKFFTISIFIYFADFI